MATGPATGNITTPGSKDLILEGDLVIKDTQGRVRIRLDSQTGNVFVNDIRGNAILLWEATANNLRFGGNGRDGDLVIFPGRAVNLSQTTDATFHFNADEASAMLGGNGSDGKLVCKDKRDNQNIFLDGASGAIRLGANEQQGKLFIHTQDDKLAIQMHAAAQFQDTPGESAVIAAGGKGIKGALHLFSENTIDGDDPHQAAVRLDAQSSSLVLGDGEASSPGQLFILGGAEGASLSFRATDGAVRLGGGKGGSLLLLPSTGNALKSSIHEATLSLVADQSIIRAGGHGTGGDILLSPSTSDDSADPLQSSIHIRAEEGTIRVGGGHREISGQILVRNKANKTTIHLDGQAGDIILESADCAEDFELAADVEAAPGSVMVIDAEGRLRPSDSPYDRRVAGIVAGAGELKPGIILGRRQDAGTASTVPIALAGRVYCKVDASEAVVQVGDLLTTSTRAGFAMKASDRTKSFGSILGKALASLDQGTALIPVLVALQ